MPVVLTPFIDGETINPNGNTFGVLAEADTYFDSGMNHLEWAETDGQPRDPDNQARSLVTAFRAISRLDYRGSTLTQFTTAGTPSVILPVLRDSQFELALHFLKNGSPESANEDPIKSLNISGVFSIGFGEKPETITSLIPDAILLMLKDFITLPDHLHPKGMRVIPLDWAT